MTEFHLRIVASSGVFYDGPCESLVLPTSDGEYGIQAYHEPMVIGINIGELKYLAGGKWYSVVTGQGYARTEGDKTVIVTDSAERPEDVDEQRALAAAERAREKLAVQKSRINYMQGQLAMTRAMARLNAKKNNKRKYV